MFDESIEGSIAIGAESLAYWYLRLNGYLTIPNLVVHPDPGTRHREQTDVDVLGVRFPYRSELLVDSMQDDERVILVPDKPGIILAEVKVSGGCRLNRSWTETRQQNMERIVQFIGAFPRTEWAAVSESLYSNGAFENEHYRIATASFARVRNLELEAQLPGTLQFIWSDVLEFIFNRFNEFQDVKRSHQQWDAVGKQLWDVFQLNQSCVESFRDSINIVMPPNQSRS